MDDKRILKLALDIICSHLYVITPVHLNVEPENNGYRVFFICDNIDKGLENHYFLAEKIEVIYKAMCESPFTSIHSRDEWALVLKKVRAWEAEK